MKIDADDKDPFRINDLFQRWCGWLTRELLYSIESLIIDLRIYQSFADSLTTYIGQSEAAEVAEWIAKNYVANVGTALRRLGDRGGDVISLRRLLDEMNDNLDILTIENVEMYRQAVFAPSGGSLRESPDIAAAVKQDLVDLDKNTRVIKKFVDKNIAHMDHRGEGIELPTFDDIRQAIEFFHLIYRKYAWWLVGFSMQSDQPSMDDVVSPSDVDFREQFTRIWRGARSA